MKFFILITFVVMATSASAFLCYQCEHYAGNTTVTNSTCYNEPVPPEFLLDCGDNPDDTNWQCVKKIGKTVEDEEKYVGRYCSRGKQFENTCKESNALDTPFGIAEKGFKCYCNTPGCNGATYITLALPLLLGAVGYNIINHAV